MFQPLEKRQLLSAAFDLVPNIPNFEEGGMTTVLVAPGQAFDVEARVLDSSDPFSGFQLNFENSDIAGGQLALGNWISAPVFDETLEDVDISDAFVADSVALFQGPLNLQNAPPVVPLGTLTVTAPGASGSFALTINREQGNDQDTLLADGSFNPITLTDFGPLQVIVDGVDPTVTVDALTTVDDTPTITGTFNDNDQVASVSIQITGQGVNQGPIAAVLDQQAKTWSVDGSLIAALPLNTYEVIATATDRIGRTGSDATNNELDIVDGPTITVDPLLSNDSTPTITGTISDPLGSVSIQIDGQGPQLPAVVNGNVWSVDGSLLTSLADGVYDVVATGADANENPGVDTTTDELTIDTVGPTVVVTSPADQAVTDDDSLTQLTVQFADANGIDQTSAESGANYELLASQGDGEFIATSQVVAIQSISFSPGNNTATLTLAAPLADDTYQLTMSGAASIQDTAGNPLNRPSEAAPGVNTVRTFQVDTTKPVLQSAQLVTDTGLFNDDFVTGDVNAVLNLIFDEPMFGLPGDIPFTGPQGQLLPAVQQFTQGQTNITISFDAPLPEGAFEINIAGLRDAAGNTVGPLLSSRIPFAVDLTAPTVPPASILLNGVATTTSNQPVTQIRVQFDDQFGLDATTAQNPNNYQVLSQGNPVPGLTVDAFNPLLRQVLLGFNPGIGSNLVSDSADFQLVIDGTASIKDVAGLTLDGDADGNPGGDFTHNFTVDTRGTGAVEGLVWDDNNGDGLRQQGEPVRSGVTINLLDGATLNVLDTDTTDGLGEYEFDHLDDGSYVIEVINPGGVFFTSKDIGPDDTIDSDVFPTPPATGRTPVFAIANGQAVNDVDAGLVQVEPPPPSDPFEPNDTLATPHDLGQLEGPNPFPGLNIGTNVDGTSNPDFFQFETLTTGRQGDLVSATFDQTLGDLDLQLFIQGSPDPIRQSLGPGNAASVSLQGLPAATYIAHVFGAPNDYDLQINAPLLNVLPDQYEPNDAKTSPHDFGQLQGNNVFADPTIHDAGGANPDFFLFETVGPSVQGHHVAIDHPGHLGQFALQLHRVEDTTPDGVADFNELNNATLLDASTLFSDRQEISLAGLPAGFYIAQVSTFADTTGAYQLTIDVPTTPGQDDSEPNDDIDNATDLDQIGNNVADLLVENLFIHDGGGGVPNPDFFKFELTEPGTAAHFVQAIFNHQEGNLGMRLFQDTTGEGQSASATATQIAQVNSITNNELISLAGLAPDTYYAEVFGTSVGDLAAYSLRLRRPLPPAADGFEPNDTPATARDFTGLEGNNRFDNLTIHDPANRDYFRFNLQRTGGQAHFVGIDFTHAGGNLDLVLHNANGTPVGSSLSVTNNERISLQGLPVGDYIVEVRGQTNTYDLQFQTPFAPTAPLPDLLEPNDNTGQATALGTPSGAFGQAGLTIHEANDQDFFQFTLAGVGRASDFLGINFLHSDGDLDLRLLNDAGVPIRSSLSSTSNERIALTGLAPGTYFGQVLGFNGATNRYDLVGQAPPPAPLVTPDAYEPFEPLGVTASQLIAGLTIHDPALNQGAGTLQDVFSITTTATGTSLDGVKFQNYNGLLSGPHWTLRNSTGGLVSQNTNPRGSTAVSFAGQPAGTYTLTVERIGSDTFGYDALFQLPSSAGPPADNHEPNDSAGAASDLGVQEGFFDLRNELTIHQNQGVANPDVFRFVTLATGEAGDFMEIQFLTTDGDLSLELLAQDGTTVLATGTQSANGQRVSFTGLERGVYFARVNGATPGDTAPYDLVMNTPVRPQGFDITLDFSGSTQQLSQSQQDAFTNAANFWEGVITGDLPEVLVTAAQLNGPADRVVDDVLIQVDFQAIDGPFGVLGSAGPRLIRTATLLPALGTMRFDTDDIAFLESQGLLELVIRHEMAHVFGYGTLWGAAFMDLIDNAGTLDPTFNGPLATAEFQTVFGVTDPLPLENTGGPGTAEGHPRENDANGDPLFGNELLTGFLNLGANPLSTISIAMLADMGYQVDPTADEGFTPPASGNAVGSGGSASLQLLNAVVSSNSSQAFLGIGDFEFGDEDLGDPDQGDALNVGGAGLGFLPDEFEDDEPFDLRENQTLSDLTLHDPALFENTGTRTDTFSFTLADTARPSQKITVQSQDADAQVTITLLNNIGGEVDSATSSGNADNLMLGLDGVAAGDYTIEITGDLNRYDLVFNGLSTIVGTQVVDRHVFYNNSDFDGNDAGANANDDAAIAANKDALLPGGQASLDNVTNFALGLNGIMVDIANLPDLGGGVGDTISAADFMFNAGTSGDPATWDPLGVAPTAVTVRPGAGADSTDRVSIIFPDGAVTETWLQVTVKANANTGLAASDVFYFGNMIGESSDNPLDTTVNATDEIGARNNQRTFLDPATVTDSFDYNRDGFVNATDEILARNNQTNFLSRLGLINPVDPGAGGASASSQSQAAANLVQLPDEQEVDAELLQSLAASTLSLQSGSTLTQVVTRSSVQLAEVSLDVAGDDDESQQSILDLVTSSDGLGLSEVA